MKTSHGVTYGATLLSLPHLRIVSDTDDCINWTGAKSTKGYGVFTLRGRQVYAHRILWEWSNGKQIPANYIIMHTCDNPLCVNPRHLQLGTTKDNVDDCNRKGRRNQVSGERHGMAKLTAEEVRIIRKDYKPRKVTLKALGNKYGVSESTIHVIVTGQKWKN